MILLIDNYDSFTYNLYQVISQLTSDVTVIRNDKLTLDKIKQMAPSGIVLSPGPGRPEAAGLCIEIVRQFAKEIPILGVCLGHQAIAVAFSGKIIKANTIMHGKQSAITHQSSALYHNIPSPFEAGRYHSLIVDRDSLPDELIIEAETADQVIMGIKHRDYLTYGVQFHPESILSGDGQVLIENFISIAQKGETK